MNRMFSGEIEELTCEMMEDDLEELTAVAATMAL